MRAAALALAVAAAVAAIAAWASTPRAAAGASAEPSISVRPTIARWGDQIEILGVAAGAKEGQKITVQFKQCGLQPPEFRDVAETTTEAGGGWTVRTFMGVSGIFRAVHAGDVSREITLQQRPGVQLQLQSGRFQVSVGAKLPFWGRKVQLQRFDARRRAWSTVKSVVLTDQGGAGVFVWTSSDKFKAVVPKKTTVRAVLPLAAARPCYLAGFSNLVRT